MQQILLFQQISLNLKYLIRVWAERVRGLGGEDVDLLDG